MIEIGETSQAFFMLFLQQVVMPILETAIAGLVVYLGIRVRAWINSNVDAATQERITAVIEQVVQAAEQSGLKGALINEGNTKLKWATDEAQRMLDERGLNKISAESIRTMIEAALRRGVHKDPFVIAELTPVNEV